MQKTWKEQEGVVPVVSSQAPLDLVREGMAVQPVGS